MLFINLAQFFICETFEDVEHILMKCIKYEQGIINDFKPIKSSEFTNLFFFKVNFTKNDNLLKNIRNYNDDIVISSFKYREEGKNLKKV